MKRPEVVFSRGLRGRQAALEMTLSRQAAGTAWTTQPQLAGRALQ